MPRCLTVAPHLTVADLEHRYRTCRVAVERSHWHMLWLLAQGHHVPAVATLTGYSVPWVRTIVHRYNADGGLWTCGKVAVWMAERLGRSVGEPRGWEAMRALGFTPQRPRPKATIADAAAQAAFKKGGSKVRSTRSGRPIPARG